MVVNFVSGLVSIAIILIDFLIGQAHVTLEATARPGVALSKDNRDEPRQSKFDVNR